MRLKLQQANHPEKISLLYGLAITYDDGVRWQRLAQALRDSSYSLDPSDLAGGDECRFSVFATDGFNTTYRDSKTFSLLIQPPMIVPLNFEENCEVLAGEPVLFEVEAISARFGSLDGDQIN